MTSKAAALVAICLCLPACATTATPQGGPSLVIASWGGVAKYLPLPKECDEPDVICMNVKALVRFKRAKTLGGSALPPRFQAALWYHSQPLPTTRLLLLVERQADGTWEADRLSYIGRNEITACFQKQAVVGIDLKDVVIPSEVPGEVCVQV